MTEWYEKDIEQVGLESPRPQRQYHDPHPGPIAAELRAWWNGIKSGDVKFIPGLPLLKKFIPAYIPGHLFAISGYTSAGKSQLLAQLTAWTAGVQNAETLVFSLEDSRAEKTMSLLSVVMETIHRKRMLLGDLDETHEGRIEQALETISCWPLKIYDDVYRMHEMETLIKKHSPKIVILDYIQNIIASGSLYERMSLAAGHVYRMAQENKATMFVASQIDNDSAREEREGFIAMKGGGELAAASHTVIHMKKGREEKNRNKVEILIKKNKAFGNCGEIECEFNSYWTTIINPNAGAEEDRWTV